MPKIIILSAPSRGGKNAVIAELLKNPGLKLHQVISYTTRPARDFEKDGVHYFFVTPEKFDALKKQNFFLETAEFNGHSYGSATKDIAQTLKEGFNPLLVIEIRGAKQVMEKFPGQTLSIFLKPPSLATLKSRFEGDSNFTPEMIKERLAIAKAEIAQAKLYDHVIINKQGELEKTVNKIKKIISG